MELKKFQVEWNRSLELGVAKLIVKNDDDGAIDLDNDGVADEIEEVCRAAGPMRGVSCRTEEHERCLLSYRGACAMPLVVPRSMRGASCRTEEHERCLLSY